MSERGQGDLVEIQNHFTSKDYIEVLEKVFLPSVRKVFPKPIKIKFVQDNSSIHKAKIVKEWFSRQEYVEVIDWPAKSPDLNPIENIWGLMVRNWEPEEIRTRENLSKKTKLIWEELKKENNMNISQNLVNSMKSRLEDVIIQDGEWTGY